MGIEVVELSDAEVNRLLGFEEGHFGDLKDVRIKPSILTKSLSALANADGGEVFIGIEEDGGATSWNGFSNQEAANGHLQVFEELFPLGHDFRYEFLSSESHTGLVLHVIVPKTGDIKYASDGKTYVRRGAQNLPIATPEALEQLRRNKGITSFETETIDIPLDTVTNSETIIEFLLNVVPTAEPKPWLEKQLMIRGDKPTVAAVLLYSDNPQGPLPKRSSIKIYRYKTTEPEGSRETLAFDPLTIEGALYWQIHEAVAKTVSIIEEIQVLGPEGFERVSYPFEALHEIITNAVLHRDYSLSDDVHVRVFDNRVEIESPGRLPAHITPENILRERFSRNGNIVRLINKFPNPPNKDVGEGLNTAFAEMRKLELKDPVIQETENAVLVTIRHERMASPEQLVMEYLETHDEINNSQGRSITGIGSENRMKRVFERLMAAHQIERVPGKRGRAAAYQRKR